MSLEQPPEAAPYRVTLFFGPEAVEDQPDTLVCVFNVKKRSWKAGIQVAVEVAASDLSTIAAALGLAHLLEGAFAALDAEARAQAEARVPDLLAQVVSWCKLDLRLNRGLGPEDVRLPAEKSDAELIQSVQSRKEYVLAYILSELDVPFIPDVPNPS